MNKLMLVVVLAAVGVLGFLFFNQNSSSTSPPTDTVENSSSVEQPVIKGDKDETSNPTSGSLIDTVRGRMSTITPPSGVLPSSGIFSKLGEGDTPRHYPWQDLSAEESKKFQMEFLCENATLMAEDVLGNWTMMSNGKEAAENGYYVNFHQKKDDDDAALVLLQERKDKDVPVMMQVQLIEEISNGKEQVDVTAVDFYALKKVLDNPEMEGEVALQSSTGEFFCVIALETTTPETTSTIY